jgi:CubicO group peptidase (beta-lactamase class C family)
VLHRRTFGKYTGHTVMPVASAGKWLVAATVMALVDTGRVAIDQPVARYLPEFRGGKSTITLRELLSHTSGLPSQSCIGDPATTLSACVARIAAGPDPQTTPGRVFSYSNVGYAVAGAVVEAVTGLPFARAFAERIAIPLGMTRTRFDAAGPNPDLAGSATSTLDDYARVVAMISAQGTSGATRILAAASVAEIERDQVAGIDTHRDAAVQITKIPTYGLGVWRDVTGPHDEARVVSGNGAFGFYPWVDIEHGTYGVVALADLSHGPEHDFPASHRLSRLARTAAAANLPARA